MRYRDRRYRDRRYSDRIYRDIKERRKRQG